MKLDKLILLNINLMSFNVSLQFKGVSRPMRSLYILDITAHFVLHLTSTVPN